MFFASFDVDKLTLQDARIIAEHIAQHQQTESLLNDQQKEKLKEIISPLFVVGKSEQEIYQKLKDFFDNFLVTVPTGQTFRFYRDEAVGKIYFADEAGFLEAQKFARQDQSLEK